MNVGILFWGMAFLFYLIRKLRNKKEKAILMNLSVTKGVVIDIHKTRSEQADDTIVVNYAPIVKFEDEHEISHVLYTKYVSKSVDFFLDQNLEIVYDQTDPSNARLLHYVNATDLSLKSYQSLTLLFFLLGLYFNGIWLIGYLYG